MNVYVVYVKQIFLNEYKICQKKRKKRKKEKRISPECGDNTCLEMSKSKHSS
jgi:hypothetical protein